MNILFLETSSKNCSVAISENGRLLALCEEVSENYRHSEDLHKFVEWALEGTEIELKDLDVVCVGKGPGSYTGLRIGAASAKGFCFGLNIPLVAVNSLDALAEPYFNTEYEIIIPMVDARRMEVYCKIFDKSGKELSPTEAKILDAESFSEYKNSKVLLVGDGARKAKELLQLHDAVFFEDQYPSAEFLIPKGFRKAQMKQFEDVAYFEPFYLKEFHSTAKK